MSSLESILSATLILRPEDQEVKTKLENYRTCKNCKKYWNSSCHHSFIIHPTFEDRTCDQFRS